ncbi:MAG: OmpA family protein [Acidobacteriota bacterium]
MNIRFSATQVSRDRWLVSYADFMTLLCAFFTTLYAASLVDGKAAAAAATPSAPVAVVAPAQPVVPVPMPAPAPPKVDEAAALRAQVEAALADELEAGYLQLVEDPRGLVVEVPEAGAFESGRAELSGDAQRMMRRVAGVLASLPNSVRVEGHTDDTPIRTTKFASNWDLSTARATSVVEFLVASGGVDPARLSAAGYSQFKPRAANSDAAGRMRNRRVDLVILNAATARAEEPVAEGQR